MLVAAPIGNHAVVAPRAIAALRKEFGDDTGVFAEFGYQGRVRLKLITPQLNGIPEQEKQEVAWRVLNEALGEDAGSISVVIAYGTDEL